MMAGEISGPPAVDFYSMLSGLGQQIQAGRRDALRRDALTAATGPDGSVDFGKAMLGLASAGDLQGAALLSQAQNHKDVLAQQEREFNRASANDAFNHRIALANLANNSEGPEEVTAQRIEAAKKIGLVPGTTEHTQYIANGSIPDAVTKPMPVETLSGTKFMVSKPGGGYMMVDPSTLAAPQFAAAPQSAASPAAPAVSPQVASAAPGSFADRFAGAYPQTNAPSPPAAPADLTAVDPATGRRENWLKAQPPDVQAYIKKIADYEIDPRTTSIKGGHREQVLSAVAQYDPTYDQNSFGSRAKAIRDFATGTQGNAVRSFDVAIDHLATLKKYVDALGSGDIRIVNELRNKWLMETGSPLPTNVQAIAPIVGAEVSKAVIGSNNALADREELRKPLQLANSIPQISGAIGGYQELMGGQLKGLKKQYEDTTGKKDFDKRIRESTRNILLGGESSSLQGIGADQALQHARDAIAQGAPKAAVIQRLKDAGIDPGGL